MKKCMETDKDNRTKMREKILNFLKKIDNDLPIPISQKTDLESYAQKLNDKALKLTFCENDEIVSMSAGYINMETRMAFISIVATLPQYRMMGLGQKVVKTFIEKSKADNMNGVHLYTHSTNEKAIKLYKNLGFVDYNVDERAGDKHLVYWLKGDER